MSRVTYWDHIYLSVCLSIWCWNVLHILKAVHSLIQEAIRHEWWQVRTMWYYTLLPAHCAHPIPLKGWISVQGHWGVTFGSTVTLSWEINEARAQKGSLRTVHICTNQQCFVTTIFSQFCQMRSERHKCATFYAPTPDLHIQGDSRDRWCWAYFTRLEIYREKTRPRKCQNAKFRSSSQCCYCYCKEMFTITPKSSPQSQPALCNFLQNSPYCTIICFLGPLVGSGLVFAWYHTVYEFLPSGLLDMQNTELCTFRLTD